MTIRRVVLGETGDGQSTVLADGVVEPTTAALLAGVQIHRVWELDEVAVPVGDPGAGAAKATFFPAHSGVRFGFLTVPPGVTYVPDSDVDLEATAAEIEERLPGVAATFTFPDQPGMHVTQTVDFIVAVSGQGVMWSGEVEVRLSQGDCLVQNATPHAWFNEGTEPFVVAFALCGARSACS